MSVAPGRLLTYVDGRPGDGEGEAEGAGGPRGPQERSPSLGFNQLLARGLGHTQILLCGEKIRGRDVNGEMKESPDNRYCNVATQASHPGH